MHSNNEIRAEVITIGDEILWGQITNTNATYISARLAELGYRTVRQTSIGDTAEAITGALQEALARAHVVLITGGLGPTKDDITKKTIAQYFGTAVVAHPDAVADLEAYFTARGRAMNELNMLQAHLPENATYLKNERGTAPGMWFEAGLDQVVISMPGVPAEMKHLMEVRVLPKLLTRFQTQAIVHRYLQTVAIPESDLAIKLNDWEDALPPHVKLAYLPSRGRVKLRLTGTGPDEHNLKAELEALAQAAVPIIGKNLYSQQDEDVETALAEQLMAHRATVAAAESCTGGAFAARLTAQPGASRYFAGSAVVYNRPAKEALGVPKQVLDTFGIYAPETAQAMAEAARAFYGTTLAVACTGIAGPATGQDPVPVGTIYIACAGPQGTQAKALLLTPDRATNIEVAVVHMLNLVRIMLQELVTPA